MSINRQRKGDINKSQDITELAKALVEFHKKVKPIAKTSENPFFKSKYADLAEIISCTKKELGDCGLSIVQGSEPAVDGVTVTTLLIHTSGQWIESNLFLKAQKQDPQGFGSAYSYGRRYSYSGILNLSTEDDDGNIATHVKTKLTEDEKLEMASGITLDKSLSQTATDSLMELAKIMHTKDPATDLKTWAQNIALKYFKVDNSAAIKKLETTKLKLGIESLQAKIGEMK